MPRFDHLRQDFLELGIHAQADHLAARNHHVDDGEIGNLDGALDHRQRVVGEQTVGLRATKFFEEFFDVPGFAGNQLAYAFQPGFLSVGTRVVLVHLGEAEARERASSLIIA